ncbi:MAG: hypothetical protein ACRDHI_05660 [Actinomycetota bacterium]
MAKYAMDDRDDFYDVERGFIAGWDEKLYSDDGLLIFDGEALGYINDDTPAPRYERKLWMRDLLKDAAYPPVERRSERRRGHAGKRRYADAQDSPR